MLTIDLIMSAYLSDLAENKLVHIMRGTNNIQTLPINLYTRQLIDWLRKPLSRSGQSYNLTYK